MRVNCSAVKTFLNDETDWYFAFHMRRVPRQDAIPLRIGTVWHLLMEYYARTGSRDDAKHQAQMEITEALREATSEEWKDDFQKQAEHIFDLFDAYEDPPFVFEKTLHIEEPLEMSLPPSDHTLIGRPDRVVQYEGKFWHIQNRTLSDRTPIATYLAAAQRDLHELGYAALICHHYDEPLWKYGGTLMNICRKISRKKLVENPRAAFVQEFIPLSENQINYALTDIRLVADRMERIARGDVPPLQNRNLDAGRFGNSLSPYFAVKNGTADIWDDTLFKTAKDRYELETSDID